MGFCKLKDREEEGNMTENYLSPTEQNKTKYKSHKKTKNMRTLNRVTLNALEGVKVPKQQLKNILGGCDDDPGGGYAEVMCCWDWNPEELKYEVCQEGLCASSSCADCIRYGCSGGGHLAYCREY
jgi:hypothetical protein